MEERFSFSEELTESEQLEYLLGLQKVLGDEPEMKPDLLIETASLMIVACHPSNLFVRTFAVGLMTGAGCLNRQEDNPIDGTDLLDKVKSSAN